MAQVTLHQFTSSHYNEKARWVLTYKGIEHERTSHLPGPHIKKMQKLSGQSSTPVLQWDDEVIPDSHDIIEYVDRKVPEKPLFPEDETQKKHVIDWCKRLDDELGPAVRTIAWSAMINHNRYATSVFGKGQSAGSLFFYRMLFPLLKPLIAKANGVNPDNIRKSEAIVERMLDELAAAVSETGYLVGDGFTAADLTAAALLAPLANPAHEDMSRPTPVVPSLQAFLDRYKPHPMISWVEKQYREQR